jgi:hypothetical protein
VRVFQGAGREGRHYTVMEDKCSADTIFVISI